MNKINVLEVMEQPMDKYSKVKEMAKNEMTPLMRLENIKGMMATLEENVRNADIGVGQPWVEAYDNLYYALQVCKSVEKDLI